MRSAYDRRPALRKVACAAVLASVIVAAGGRGVALAEPVGGLGAADRLVVRGTKQIDAEQLRGPLVRDTDIVWLSRPHASREAFIAAIVRKAMLALERSGFAEAQVQASVEASDGVERLVLDVTEGPRFEAGAIEVTGLPDETKARLVWFLSEQQPPRDTVPREIQHADETITTTWLTGDGRPARPPAMPSRSIASMWPSPGSFARRDISRSHCRFPIGGRPGDWPGPARPRHGPRPRMVRGSSAACSMSR